MYVKVLFSNTFLMIHHHCLFDLYTYFYICMPGVVQSFIR